MRLKSVPISTSLITSIIQLNYSQNQRLNYRNREHAVLTTLSKIKIQKVVEIINYQLWLLHFN